MLTLQEAINCNSFQDFENLRIKHNILFYWQKQTTDFVYTYDRMPEKCIDEYYGSDIDLRCPGAWAFRKRIWPVFSFEQARKSDEFKDYDPDSTGEKHWQKFGIKDCLFILSGSPKLNSFASFSFNHYIQEPYNVSLPYIALTHKMDIWLNNHPELKPYSREFSGLSVREKEVMALHLKNPDLCAESQAEILGISTNTLKCYRDRIAKKYSVTSFASAIPKAMNLREFDFSPAKNEKQEISLQRFAEDIDSQFP